MRRSARAEGPPSGLAYIPDFVTGGDAASLLAFLRSIDFRPVIMHGVTAKRTTRHYGWDYGYESWRISEAEAIPEQLLPLRARAAAIADLGPEALEEVLVSHYPPGAGIGWHRDAPMFGPTVIGISLGGDCVMKFRRKEGDGFVVWPQTLQSGSLYLLGGEARSRWQHTIASSPEERYSITYRTVIRKPR